MSPNVEFETVEFFVPCDPASELEEDRVEDEFVAMLSGAVLGGLGFDALHHAIEGLEHVSEIADALRPTVQPQQVTAAIQAYRRNPCPFAPGEIKGVWVRFQVPRQRLNQVVLRTAPSLRQPNAPTPPAPPARRPSPRLHLRCQLRPTWT